MIRELQTIPTSFRLSTIDTPLNIKARLIVKTDTCPSELLDLYDSESGCIFLYGINSLRDRIEKLEWLRSLFPGEKFESETLKEKTKLLQREDLDYRYAFPEPLEWYRIYINPRLKELGREDLACTDYGFLKWPEVKVRTLDSPQFKYGELYIEKPKFSLLKGKYIKEITVTKNDLLNKLKEELGENL